MEDYTAATKACAKCGVEYPRTIEFFIRHPRRKEDVGSWCKLCQREYSKQWDNDNPENRKAIQKRHDDKRKEKRRLYDKQRYANNPDKQKAYSRQYKQDNYETVREKDRQRKHNHPEKRRVYYNNRKARILAADGIFTADDIMKIGDSQSWRCWWCGEDCKSKYHVDHRVPLARGGTNWPSNLVIACPKCNCSKSDKLPDEFCGRLL